MCFSLCLLQNLREKMLNDIAALSQQVRSLKMSLDCQAVNDALEKFVPAICEYSLEGLFIIAASILCTCFALSAVICAAPRTWKRYSKYIPWVNYDARASSVCLHTRTLLLLYLVISIIKSFHKSFNEYRAGKVFVKGISYLFDRHMCKSMKKDTCKLKLLPYVIIEKTTHKERS